MDRTSDLAKVECLMWETKKPLFGKFPRESSTFWLLGCEWKFKLELTVSQYNISLRKVTNEEPLTTGLRVKTYVRGESGYTCRCVAGESKVACQLVWWHLADPEYEALWPDLRDGKWTAVFTFRSDQPLMLHLSGSETDLSGHEASPVISLNLECLSGDLHQLLEDETFTDVKLRCGDSSISAHRSILAARSEVFAAMFRNKMAESETGAVDITDVDSEVLDSLLKYVYSGKIPELCEDSASSLYEAADKYSVHTLKKSCSDWMVRNLTAENCLGYLLVADAHSDEDFKERVADFTAENLGSLKKDVWLEFDNIHSRLAVSVYRRLNVQILSKQA